MPEALAADSFAYPQVAMLIGGQWRVRGGVPIQNPADETVVGPVPNATVGDLDEALLAASKGFALWRKTAPSERSRIMHRTATLLCERMETIARTLTIEQGKPPGESRIQVERASR